VLSVLLKQKSFLFNNNSEFLTWRKLLLNCWYVHSIRRVNILI
jgi:hypothetical protein